MFEQTGKIIVNDATSQYARLIKALGPGYVKVDGRTMPELLNFAPQYGALINYYDLDDTVNGDWVKFFLTDDSMILASMRAVNLTEVEREFEFQQQKTAQLRHFERKFRHLKDTFGIIYDLAAQVNMWLIGIANSPGNEVLRLLHADITMAIESSLGEQLRLLKSYDEGAGESVALGRSIGLNYESFLPIWNLRYARPDPRPYRGNSRIQKIDHALPYLNPLLNNFVDELTGLLTYAKEHLRETLDTGEHKPQIALYMAFAQLFRHAQSTMNTMAHRYLRFYYHRVLREPLAGAVGDNVYLTFAQEADVLTDSYVAKGTQFPAGEDADQQSIIYAADKALLVTPARISRLHALRIRQGSLFAENDGVKSAYVSDDDKNNNVMQQVLASTMLVSEEAAESDGDEPITIEDAWDTFGETSLTHDSSVITQSATLGLALASPYLLLSGGVRTVDLSFAYPDSYQIDVLNGLLDQIVAAIGGDRRIIWQKILDQAFELFLSTPHGWLQVESYTASLTPFAATQESKPNARTLAPGQIAVEFFLQLILNASAPAISAFDPENEGSDDGGDVAVSDDPQVNATNPDSTRATLKVYLKQAPITVTNDGQSVDVYCYPFFANMPLVGLALNTTVAGLPGVQIENTDGEVDTTSPYALFGGQAVVGSYVQIRHDELFAKVPSSVTVSIDWFDLPPNDNGFKGYYRNYTLDLDGKYDPDLFNNQIFCSAIGILNPGYWFLGQKGEDCPKDSLSTVDEYLFRTQDGVGKCQPSPPAAEGTLCSVTEFDNFQVCMNQKAPDYYQPSQSAIRITLTEPSYTFGQDLYAINVLNSVIKDLPDAGGCQLECSEECQALEAAVASLQQCIDSCGEQPADDYPACIKPCLVNCQKQLWQSFVDCLMSCIESSDNAEVAGTLRSILEQAETGLRDKSIRHTQVVTECRAALRQFVAQNDNENLKKCVQSCLVFLNSIICISAALFDCRSLTGEDYKTCLQEKLNACLVKLTNAYKKCVCDCMWNCMGIKKELEYPNEPYLPQAQNLIVGYNADCEWLNSGENDACGSLYHLSPFGGYRELEENQISFFPRYEASGHLWIGFSSMLPPQAMTLLFQMVAGDTVTGKQWPTLQWQYLSENQWRDLQENQLTADSTNGLQQSGIVAMNLPEYDANNHTVLPANYQWLAAVTNQPDEFPCTVSINPHALKAGWDKQDNSGEHLSEPLPPYTIDSSLQELGDIATIEQPMASFGGRPPENAESYPIRLSERLRHKDRAIQSWDYERLVLERFPSIWKVVAMPARNTVKGNEPGNVLVVVVAGPRTPGVIDTTEPMVSSDMCREIQSYLQERASHFVTISVVNPTYVRIKVTAHVDFNDAQEPGNYLEMLDQDLVAYLSPWFYSAERAAKKGQYVSESDIADFMQNRPYVKHLVSMCLDYDPMLAGLKSEWCFMTSATSHCIYDASISDLQVIK